MKGKFMFMRFFNVRLTYTYVLQAGFIMIFITRIRDTRGVLMVDEM